MNNKNNFEFLSEEELIKMDENLKKTENIRLPESLSPENISEKLKNIPQEETAKLSENNVAPIKPKKQSNKKKVYRAVAAIAAVIVAVTSLAVVKPWQETPLKQPDAEDVVNNNENDYEDYSEIENMFAEYSKKYKSHNLRNSVTGFFTTSKDAVEEGFVINDAASAAPQSNMSSSSIGSTVDEFQSENSSSHGETNEQVKGVSEADIIKNDGKYLYIVNNDEADWATYYEAIEDIALSTGTVVAQTTPSYNPESSQKVGETEEEKTSEKKIDESSLPELQYGCFIQVVEPKSDGKLEIISRIKVEKPEDKKIIYVKISEIYISGNRLFVLAEGTYRNEDLKRTYYGYHTGVTIAVSYDISDIKNPKEEWRFYQQGNYISSRLIGDELVLLSSYYVDITAEEKDVIAKCVPEISVNDKAFSRISCDCIRVMEEVNDTSYLVASVMDTDDEKTLKTEAVLGAGENVYCTTETLYATSTEYKNYGYKAEVFGLSDSDNIKTQIYKFDIRNYEIKFLKSEAVSGRALNQFSIDEYNGYLRLATTSGNWGDSLKNQLYVLNENLEQIGIIENIAKGETIKSVRFTGDTAYVVTFEQTDPLFVIDLSEPSKPEIKGELKIPGYSSYLHPAGENLVLGVGVDGTERGTNGGLKVSLFDVSDPKNPKECDKYTINVSNTENRSGYVDSAAYSTHKALCWDNEEKIMYIPYGKCEETFVSYTDEYFSERSAGIIALKVDETVKSLSEVGSYIAQTDGDYWVPGFTRVTYINDIVFGFTQKKDVLYSFDKATCENLDSLSF